jgi:hypothetical protein
MIDINKIPIVNPAQLEKFLEGSVKVEMEYPEIYKKNKKNKVSKLKTIIDKSLESVFWVSHSGKFLGSSDYPQEFEQKFGNISNVSLSIDDYLFDKQQIDKIHEFLKKWGFDVTQQFKINEYNTGYYYCDDLTLMVRATFGMPEDKVEKEDDDDGPAFGVSANNGISISFSPLVKNRKMIEDFLKEFVDGEFLFLPASEKSFYMIAQTQHGLTKQKTNFSNIEIKDNRYDIYYGSKFPYDKFKKFMKDENTESLLLLHGPPGGGKSNLLKNLIMEAEEDVIYVPPSMVSVISSPGFISFMLQNKKNFLIIEDAEEILSTDRNSGTNNLLGICDGFLKDALQMKIICTFNCDLKKIDPALLRKGRLYFEYKFAELSIEEGQRLADFCELDIKIDKEMTLAEIFNHYKDTSVENSFVERSMGFGNF